MSSAYELFHQLVERGKSREAAADEVAALYPSNPADMRQKLLAGSKTPADEGKVKVNSMFDTYMAHRRSGAAPKPAAQLTCKHYGQTDSEAVRQIATKLIALEQREATPTDTGQFSRTEAA